MPSVTGRFPQTLGEGRLGPWQLVVSPERLEAAGEDPRARDEAVYRLLREQRPVVLVVFPGWYPISLIMLRSSLSPIAEVVNKDNITSGDQRLVAFALDWAR